MSSQRNAIACSKYCFIEKNLRTGLAYGIFIFNDQTYDFSATIHYIRNWTICLNVVETLLAVSTNLPIQLQLPFTRSVLHVMIYPCRQAVMFYRNMQTSLYVSYNHVYILGNLQKLFLKTTCPCHSCHWKMTY